MQKPTEEAADILAAARAALGEFVEEGIDRMPATVSSVEGAEPALRCTKRSGRRWTVLSRRASCRYPRR